MCWGLEHNVMPKTHLCFTFQNNDEVRTGMDWWISVWDLASGTCCIACCKDYMISVVWHLADDTFVLYIQAPTALRRPYWAHTRAACSQSASWKMATCWLAARTERSSSGTTSTRGLGNLTRWGEHHSCCLCWRGIENGATFSESAELQPSPVSCCSWRSSTVLCACWVKVKAASYWLGQPRITYCRAPLTSSLPPLCRWVDWKASFPALAICHFWSPVALLQDHLETWLWFLLTHCLCCVCWQSHTEELWGLAAHPNQHQFLTCSYDRMLYLWDTLTHTPIWSYEVNVSHTAAAASFSTSPSQRKPCVLLMLCLWPK